MKNKNCTYNVYLIGWEDDLPPYYLNSYVGVTNNIIARWKRHTKSKYTVGQYIRKMNFSFEKNMKVIFTGSFDECFSLEKKLRPMKNLGLNEAIGGEGGCLQSYSDDKRKAARERVLGSKNPMFNKQHKEESIKLMKSYKWWNDGEDNVQSIESPGEGWVLGRLSWVDPEALKGKNKGKKRTLEDRQKMSEYRIGKWWWTNGEINRKSSECPADGFYRGRTKKKVNIE
ncbi:MAG: NUMOD3 domain-containing DNA-binding protein [Legionella sp.]|uniref:NUMOD3 domain-containing DNA-binding protein n=1 Tax=Legionella sp. TaxID=459 RepID=UPI002843635C|nr:NUMOD3 domain-containing DNA-binding protein [Legionella sp.]